MIITLECGCREIEYGFPSIGGKYSWCKKHRDEAMKELGFDDPLTLRTARENSKHDDPFHYTYTVQGKKNEEGFSIHRAIFEFPNHPLLRDGDKIQFTVTVEA